MEHITEKYGRPVNYIRCTRKEYNTLYNFLMQLGVEIRMMIWDGETDTVEIQARNGYKDWCAMYRDRNIKGGQIEDIVEKEIESGHWRR